MNFGESFLEQNALHTPIVGVILKKTWSPGANSKGLLL